MYSLATATAWILLEALGTVRLTVSLSSSVRIEGIVLAVCWFLHSCNLATLICFCPVRTGRKWVIDMLMLAVQVVVIGGRKVGCSQECAP